MKNPYPETITDEATGIEIRNPLWDAWDNGYLVGKIEQADKMLQKKWRQDERD